MGGRRIAKEEPGWPGPAAYIRKIKCPPLRRTGKKNLEKSRSSELKRRKLQNKKEKSKSIPPDLSTPVEGAVGFGEM